MCVCVRAVNAAVVECVDARAADAVNKVQLRVRDTLAVVERNQLVLLARSRRVDSIGVRDAEAREKARLFDLLAVSKCCMDCCKHSNY